ncbi:MAG: ABC transporter ATP-binding protein [Clostridiales bacterium]|jgi:NitT/TauT family transport system ATP-binding protein|nr:ABC transporter ATP-binding protein [Clostridiales bacterium]
MSIKMKNICKSFNGQQVLSDVSMSFSEGKITCIMGASGVGKTTLINILMGLWEADSGEITGINNKKISAVFQEDRLIEHWDAIKNILLVCSGNVTDEIVKKHLEDIGLVDYEGKPVRALSGGMRRRVAIVRAILSEYDILFMDEPFKGLDEKLKNQVVNYVRENTKGKTLIVITHDRDEVAMLGGELVYLNSRQ